MNWNPFVDRPMTLRRGACRVVRHVLLRGREPLLRTRRRGTRPAAAVGPPLRLRPADRARHRRRGGRAAAHARLAQEDVRERLGSRLEPRGLHPARDRAEGPARHAAPDGGSVRDARERRERRHAVSRLQRRAAPREELAARRAPPVRAAPAEAVRSRPRRAHGGPRRALPRDARRERDLLGRLRQLRHPDLREDGHGGEGRRALPATRQVISRTDTWWCGWGPSDNAKLVVCALIENGGHGSTAAAPAALRMFESYFKASAPPSVLVSTD